MALIRQTGILGNHPILFATTAASGGVLLGVYVAMQVFAAPVPNGAKVPAAAPVAESKPPVKPIEKPIETTASAPAKEKEGAAADRCEGQTWPNLSRECAEQMQKNRPARVVTTDRVEKPVPETPAQPRTESVASLPAPVAPAQSAAPATTAPAPAAAAPSVSTSTSIATATFAPNTAAPPAPAVKPAPSQPAVAAIQPAPPPAAAEPAPKPSTTVAVAAPGNPQDAIGANEPSAASKAAEKRKAKEVKRNKKKERENLDDDGLAFAAVDRDRESRSRDARDGERADRAERRSLRAESRSDRSRRLASRDEDNEGDTVADRRGGRRVLVIERDSDRGEQRGGGLFGRGGLFGGLFGN